MSYIYERCTADGAIDRARAMGRLQTDTTSGNFTPAAIRALFEYHESLAEDTGEPIELDVIAWCCDWAEYDMALEAAAEQGYDARNEEDARGWLEEQTTILDTDADTIVVASF